MAQAKKKTATKTAKKTTGSGCKSCKKTCTRTKKQQAQKSNMFFVVSMSVLAATLLFADLMLLSA